MPGRITRAARESFILVPLFLIHPKLHARLSWLPCIDGPDAPDAPSSRGSLHRRLEVGRRSEEKERERNEWHADRQRSGLEADQKVIAAHGCYAQTATTALTAQDTKGVYDIHHVPSEFLARQIDLCVEDVGVDVVKTGMLASADAIRAVTAALQRHALPVVVVDPVMVATSGAQLLPQEAVRELLGGLLPKTTVLTPNIPEARLLLKEAGYDVPEVQSVQEMEVIAKQARKLGPKWVLVKGGHVPFTKEGKVARADAERELVVDVLCGPDDAVFKVESPFQGSTSTHGTGCSLACGFHFSLAYPVSPLCPLSSYYPSAF